MYGSSRGRSRRWRIGGGGVTCTFRTLADAFGCKALDGVHCSARVSLQLIITRGCSGHPA